MKNTIVTEGLARISIPRQCLTDPFHCEVFYNPWMQFNRSLSSLFLESALKITKIDRPLLFDGFSGTGIRGIRYLKEAGVNRVVFCDANDATVPFIKKNISLNKVQKKSEVLHMDVNQGLAVSPRFDVIELDPFGSAVNFLDSAFRRGGNKFILSLTFTDLANLCGGHKDACKRYYGAVSLHCSFSHELAMRIILAKAAVIAAQFDFSVTPLVSWYEGHYVKIFLLCEKSARKASENFDKIGFAWLCPKCSGRGVYKNVSLSCSCGGEPEFAGPLWIANYSDKKAIKAAISILKKKNFYDKKEKKKLDNFLNLLYSEIEDPLFYSLPELCSRLKVQVPRLNDFVQKLKKTSFTASKTHFSPDCFKTKAVVLQLFDFLRV